MDKNEAKALIGPLEDRNEIIDQANEGRSAHLPDEPFFPGRNTTWGYARPSKPVDADDIDYAVLCEAVKCARELARRAQELELYLSSETDNPYEPFVVRLDQAGDDFVARLRASLGLHQAELLVDKTVAPASKFLFMDEDELEYARGYLEDEEDNDDPSEDDVLAAIGKDEDQSCFDEEQAAAYRQLTAMFAERLTNLHHLSFDWDEQPKKYPVSPTFFVGEYKGHALGLWANRVWT